jgi:hypothetical protein
MSPPLVRAVLCSSSREVVRIVLDSQSAVCVRNLCSSERFARHGTKCEAAVLLKPGISFAVIAHEKEKNASITGPR